MQLPADGSCSARLQQVLFLFILDVCPHLMALAGHPGSCQYVPRRVSCISRVLTYCLLMPACPLIRR